MSHAAVDRIEALVQQEVGRNIDFLFAAAKGGLFRAASALAGAPRLSVGIMTGFYVPKGTPPAAETDGPVGAALLAAAFSRVGVPCRLVTDEPCHAACAAALAGAGVGDVPLDVVALGGAVDAVVARWRDIGVTHALSIERCGRSADGSPRNMRGEDISSFTTPLDELFTAGPWQRLAIGDGGNEIGMGSVPASLIGEHVAHGETIACVTPADCLIVAGVSNWGAYALIGALATLRRDWRDPLLSCLDADMDQAILQATVYNGPAVDGVTRTQGLTVDSLAADVHHAKLRAVRAVARTMQPREFVCEGYGFEPATGTLSLRYAFDTGQRFEETIVFPVGVRSLSADENLALDRVFRMLLLACGVSYYKALVPPRFVCAAFPVDAVTAAFFTDFYVKGLAEFAYRNGVDVAGRFHIEGDVGEAPAAIPISLPRRTCVPAGGGKNSIVTVECLAQANEPLVLFSLGTAAPIEATIRQSGQAAIRVTRRLDPALFDLNAAGALNGHVPITGILSMIVLACAIICGFDTIAMSNEHSASAPNVTAGGVDVNHQWSKSFAFEQSLQDYVARHVMAGVRYFSFLRPLSEIAIARRFARHAAYLPAFRSCNTAFRQLPEQRSTGWCCNCPKCRFVFLALAPFITKDRLVATFGRNLLDDTAQIDGFAELCGLQRHKPFECVGEIEESATVMRHLAQLPEWHTDAVVRALSSRVPARDFETLFVPRGPHAVPDRFMAMLDACG